MDGDGGERLVWRDSSPILEGIINGFYTIFTIDVYITVYICFRCQAKFKLTLCWSF